MTLRALWSLLAVLIIALVGLVVYKAWPVLFPEVVVRAALDPDCDLRAGPCVSILPAAGEVSFAIEPREIPLVTPLQLTVALSGVVAHKVEVDFSGVDMYMGYNRVELKATASGGFQGEGRIPVCVRDAMEWEASVLLYTDQGTIDVPYRFITLKPGVTLPE